MTEKSILLPEALVKHLPMTLLEERNSMVDETVSLSQVLSGDGGSTVGFIVSFTGWNKIDSGISNQTHYWYRNILSAVEHFHDIGPKASQ